jgi:hypothetical protein
MKRVLSWFTPVVQRPAEAVAAGDEQLPSVVEDLFDSM